MKCSYCNFENPEKSRFCGKCGKVFLKRENSYTKIFVALIIIGILAIIMLDLPNLNGSSGNEKIQTPVITDTPTATPPEPGSIGATAKSPAPTSIILETSPPSVLTRIIVSPSTISIVPGKRKEFLYISNDQFGKIISTTVVWTSSDTTVGIIDNRGVFTSIAPGTTIITASSGAVSGSAIATVAQIPVLTTITVSPSTVSMVVGGIQSFNAVTLDQFSKPITASLTWSSSNSAVGTIDSSGRFTSIAAGSTTITASSGSISNTATVTVIAPLGSQIFDFVGIWLNVDPINNGIPKIEIGSSGSNLKVHGYGACTPTYCDWGTVIVPFSGNPVKAIYTFSFKTDTLTMTLLPDGRLHVNSKNVFTDGTNRDYIADYYFRK